jgi:hypothetical protein
MCIFENISYNLSAVEGFNQLVFDDMNTNSLKVNKINYKSNNCRIIRYDKSFLFNDNVNTLGLCRSIIVNNQNKIISFAPPKSLPTELFFNPTKIVHNDDIIAQEFIEGTMINAFYDENLGWEIATRSIIGAESSFYKSPKSKSFREMFFDTGFNLELLDKSLCYSFVLQHPENRIVMPITSPKLYLVGVYQIVSDRVLMHDIYKFHYPLVEMPKLYSFNNYSELKNKYASMDTPYDIMGVVLYNKTNGERTKIRNPVYEEVRRLRGNQSKLQYQYLCLRNDGKVKDFLHYYPENKKLFAEYRDQLHSFTETLYNNYISCYVNKEKSLINYSEQYRTHMFTIHQLYLNELKTKKMFVTNTVVQKYVNQLNPSLLMYCLNYHMHKNNNQEKM